MRGLILVTATLLAGTAISPVMAQPTTTTSTDPAASASEEGVASEEDAQQIQDIVVTAQRREERLQDVPISVTALSSEQLSSAGVANAQDLAVLSPSLQSGGSLSNFQPRIRGIGSSTTGPGVESSVATYIDGVYIAAMPASLFSFAGVERVEILKGPQGTLFGRNATGGLIQVVTKRPSFTSSGTVDIGYGNYQTLMGDAYLTGPLSENIAFDVAFHGLTQGEGYGTNEFTGDDTNKTDYDIAVRSQLYFDSRGGTTVRLAGDYFVNDGSNPALRPYPSKFGFQRFGPNPMSNRPWDNDTNVPYNFKVQGYGLSARVEQELGFADLTSITAWRKSKYRVKFDLDQTEVDALAIRNIQKDRQFSQEVQLASKSSSRVTWLLGGYYFNAKGRVAPQEIIVGSVLTPIFMVSSLQQFATQSTRSYAAFGQATVPLGDVVNATAGLRYTSERRYFSGDQFAFLPDGTNIGVIASQPRTKIEFNRLTWRFALDRKIAPDILAYASYNRGFKSGGFNALGTLGDPPYEPEVLDAFEVGLKADLLDRRLRVNTALFYYDYQDIQVPVFTSGVIQIVNGPSAKVYGLDLDFVAKVTRALTLRGGASIIHDRFGDFPGAVRATPDPAGGNILTQFNAKGNRLPLTADWALTVAADYEFPISFGEVLLNVTYNHNDGYFTEADNIRRQGSYDYLTASARLSALDEQLSFTVWGKNLTNEAIALNMQSSVNGGGAQYQAPRTYGLTVGFKY